MCCQNKKSPLAWPKTGYMVTGFNIGSIWLRMIIRLKMLPEWITRITESTMASQFRHEKTHDLIVMAFVLGAMTVPGFAPTDFFILPILTFAALFWLWLTNQNSAQSAWIGFAFGLGFFGFGVNWMFVTLTLTQMPLLLSILLWLLFCSLLSSLLALAGWIQSKSSANQTIRLLVFIPSVLLFMDWIRTWLFSGFPWLVLGYSQVPVSPLAGYAPILGVLGVSYALLLSAALLVHAIRTTKKWARWTALTGIALLWVGGSILKQIEWTKPYKSPVSVSLLQGNIAHDKKFRNDMRIPTLNSYRQLIEASKNRLIILPESAFPMFMSDIPRPYLASLVRHAKKNGSDILVSALEGSGDKYFNSVFSIGVSPIQVYRKRHLVPFGEFVPFASLIRPLYRKATHIDLIDTSAGPSDQPLIEAAGQRIALSICFENEYGNETSRTLSQATLLVSVSNGAWYGTSIAHEQDLQMSQMRAVESGHYLLRASDSGVTALIDQHGNVLKRAPDFEMTSLDGVVQGMSGRTPYVRWRDWPVVWLCFTGLIAGFFPRHIRTR